MKGTSWTRAGKTIQNCITNSAKQQRDWRAAGENRTYLLRSKKRQSLQNMHMGVQKLLSCPEKKLSTITLRNVKLENLRIRMGSVVSSKSPPDPSRFHRFTGSPPGSCVVLHARQRGPSTPGTSSGWVPSQSFQWFWWLKTENKLDPRCQNRSRVAKVVMWYFESVYSFLRKPRGPLWWSHSHLSKELGIDPQNLNSSLCNHREGPNHLLSQTHHAMQAVWPSSTRSSCTCNTRITFFHATINIAQNPKVM